MPTPTPPTTNRNPVAQASRPCATPTPINRRHFIRLGGATAALAAFPTIIPAKVLGPNAPSKQLNFGLIGCGQMGQTDLENITRAPTERAVRARAVCDVDAVRATETARHVDAAYDAKNACLRFNDFRQLTRHPDIDAVIIATPDHWHALTAIDAVRHGKDVYVEKPLTLTIAEGRALVTEAAKHGRIGQTGTQQRSGRNFHRAAELVRNGVLGKIHRVEITIPANNRHCPATWSEDPVPPGFDYDLWLGPAPWAPFTRQRTHYQFRFILDYALGQTTNFGAHHVDICQWALGRDGDGPVRFEGYGEFPNTGLFTSPTLIDIKARYADGALMTMTNRGPTGGRSGGAGGAKFIGERGWIEVTRRGLKASTPALLAERASGDGWIHLYESRNHMGNFIDCIRSRRATIAPLSAGHSTTTVCIASMIAMQLRRPLDWDPAKEEFKNDPTANRMRTRAMRAPWSLAAK
jgi:nicotinamidase-related amidase